MGTRAPQKRKPNTPPVVVAGAMPKPAALVSTMTLTASAAFGQGGACVEASWRTDYYYEHRTLPKKIPPGEDAIGEKWKYIRRTNETPILEELFDPENDPPEPNNLANNKNAPKQLAQMRACCDTLRAEAGASGVRDK